ncbi:putative late blight resistance protein homolog R1B-16 [Salvia hispanica]|uniref:putative late blight resistance protein homolog R1B-16 n=1 Tax=Salvia hispanica TaxID=49212 RepID=UPI002009DB97|nr:putative late blight resistance protein homolog R1B-16 [Salvia hispanica]
MAAYAALVSLMNMIDSIKNHHSPPISLHKPQIQSLIEYGIFLLEFLQAYKSPVPNHDEADPLEMRIADAAYAAEDVIESHIVHKNQLTRSIKDATYAAGRSEVTKIRCSFNCFRGTKDSRNVSSNHNDDDDDEPNKLHQDMQNVIEEMDRIKRVAMETNAEEVVVLCDQRRRSVSSSIGRKSTGTMVFSDHVLHGIMEKLVADEPGRQVIPITGMGGIGKTALAQTVYSQQVIKERFDICAWATIFEHYNTREILCELVSQATNKDKKQLSESSEEELGLELYQYLSGKRFLIVMDDMWNIESWNEIQYFFPNNENNSRIMVTTRLSQLSSQLNSHYSHQVEFLDEASSWILLSKIVFGDERCTLELEKIGKEIANNCRGLPLSIVVVGGLLKNMEQSQECWATIRNNLTSVVNLDNDQDCLKLLKMSYNHLPVHLKPCFLYMGVFEEDDAISVSTLVKLWVCEGFLKPIDGRSLETIGKGFVKDLIDRNLILVDELGSTGNIKLVKVHDLVRDLCLNQAKKEGFYHVIGEYSPRGVNIQRRIVIRKTISKDKLLDDLQCMSHARSVICEHGKVPLCQNFELLRTIHAYKFRTFEYERYVNCLVSGYVNLRQLAVKAANMSSIFSSFNHFWNLQTLIVSCPCESIGPTEMWKMPQLRHIDFGRRLLLPDPPSDAGVMENLVVLEGALNFKCDKEVVKRIPNIKKLRIRYSGSKGMDDDDYYCLSNIKFLCKLESLHISSWYDFSGNASLYKIIFPRTLKSLTLDMEDHFEWENVLQKIGSLPLLEKFKLWEGCFGTGKWEIFDGQFPCLKYLGLFSIPSLKQWTAEASSIFPRLEKLRLFHINGLKNIPSEIGYIPTIQKIWMDFCGELVVTCAKEIVEEQMYLQGDDLPFLIQVRLPRNRNEALLNLAGPNFEVV